MSTAPASSRSIADALVRVADKANIKGADFSGALAPAAIKASKQKADTQLAQERERRKAAKASKTAAPKG